MTCFLSAKYMIECGKYDDYRFYMIKSNVRNIELWQYYVGVMKGDEIETKFEKIRMNIFEGLTRTC